MKAIFLAIFFALCSWGSTGQKSSCCGLGKRPDDNSKTQVIKHSVYYDITKIDAASKIKAAIKIEQACAKGNKRPGRVGVLYLNQLKFRYAKLEAPHSDFTHTFVCMNRPIRVLVAKIGLDGHDRGAKVIATALRDAGMEVIYTGLRQTPEMVIQVAIQEDVDVIGISILSGAHMTVFPKVLELMKAKQMDDVLLVGGGIVPDDDATALTAMGVGRIFVPGSTTQSIADYIKAEVAKKRNF